MNWPVWDLFKLIYWTLVRLARSQASLEAEILALRHLSGTYCKRKIGRRRHLGRFYCLLMTMDNVLADTVIYE